MKHVLIDVLFIVMLGSGTPPVFINPPSGGKRFLLAENFDLTGHSLINVMADDIDGDTLTYAIKKVKPPLSSFILVNKSLQLAGSFDAEEASYYLIRLSVSDGIFKTVSSKVEIEVLDRNDNLPVFLPNQERVSLEKQPQIGQAITRIQAIDADISSILRYSIIGSRGCSCYTFEIERNTGDLYYNMNVSLETPCYLQVQVSDMLNVAVQNVTISVDRIVHPHPSSVTFKTCALSTSSTSSTKLTSWTSVITSEQTTATFRETDEGTTLTSSPSPLPTTTTTTTTTIPSVLNVATQDNGAKQTDSSCAMSLRNPVKLIILLTCLTLLMAPR